MLPKTGLSLPDVLGTGQVGETVLQPRLGKWRHHALAQTPGRMYNRRGAAILTSMKSQYRFQLAVAAISISALSLQAQSTRVADMDTDTKITSLTSLHPPRHASQTFGGIDARANYDVTLDVSAAPDLTSAEVPNQLQAGNASRRSGVNGTVPAQLFPSGSSPGTITESIRVAKTYSVQMPSSQLPQGRSFYSQQSNPIQSSRGISSRSPPGLGMGNVSQRGSIPNAPSPSNATMIPACRKSISWPLPFRTSTVRCEFVFIRL